MGQGQQTLLFLLTLAGVVGLLVLGRWFTSRMAARLLPAPDDRLRRPGIRWVRNGTARRHAEAEVDKSLRKLERLGLIRREGDGYVVTEDGAEVHRLMELETDGQ